MTYLVTGATGLVGAYTTRDLVRRGERVIAYDIAPNMKLLSALLSEEELAKITVVRGDVADTPQVMHTLREHNVHTIIHLASLLTVAANSNFPLAHRVMVQGTNNMFEGAALLGLRKVAWASSGGVFGPRSIGPDGMVHNDSPHDPQNTYGACKSFNEAMALHYVGQYGLDLVGLRFSLVYGYGRATAPGSGTGATYMYELVDRPALGLGPSSVPFGDITMDWVYVEDVARAVLLAAQVEKPRSKAFIIHGFRRSMREAFDHVRSLLPDAKMELLPGVRESGSHILDGSAATEELGFTAEIDMEEGLKRNINMLRREAGLPAVG
jgi:UDP-glucose 4-epimerase